LSSLLASAFPPGWEWARIRDVAFVSMRRKLTSSGIDGGSIHRSLGEPDEPEEVSAGVQGDCVETLDGLRIEQLAK